MTGIIDVGGGMKCAYSAGLYDYFMDNSIEFDYYLGVSAGSMNLLSYIAGERGRNIEMYRSSASGGEYLSISNFVHTGAYMNYEKVRADFYSDTGAQPFNFGKFYDCEKPFVVSATAAQSGRTLYFGREHMKDRKSLLDIVSASCCLPLVSKAQLIDGEEYFDGGLAEPIPFRKAFEDGCDRLIVVMSSPVDQKRERLPGLNIIGPALLRQYPNIDDVLEDRHIIYNYMIRCMKEYERQGRALIFSPEDIPGAFSLVKDVDVINRLYENGYRDGLNNMKEVERLLQQ